MTTVTLTGTYSSGYLLQSPVTNLTLAASAYVGGTGITTPGTAAYTVANYGTVIGSALGLNLAAGGSITNGSETDTTALISGGHWGVYDHYTTATLTNFGSVQGAGVGGVRVGGGSVTNGSASDTTAMISGRFIGILGYYEATAVINFGTVTAAETCGVYLGTGGSVTNGSAADTMALISAYFQGVIAGNTAATVINFGTVTAAETSGVRLVAGGSVANGSASDAKALISGGTYGVYALGSAATVTNYGTIAGGTDAVLFQAASDRLIAETGSSFVGAVLGGGGTLELASGSGAITGLGAAGTVSGAVSIYFSGFGAYVIDPGGAWTLTGLNPLAAGQTLTNDGGDLSIAGGQVLNGGTIAVADAGELDFVGQQTFDDATLDLGLDGSDVSVTVRNDVNSGTPPSETVTFGAGLNVVAGYGSITIDQGRHEVPDTLVNAGAITVGSTATAGDTFTIATSGYGEFDNQGTITVTNGETLDLTPQIWTNTGTITVDGGSTLDLGGSFGSADFNNITVQNGGTVSFAGGLNNVGTISITAGETFQLVAGGISGGTMTNAGTIDWQGGSLGGVTYEGSLDLGGGRLILDDVTVTGADGAGPGTVHVDGGGDLQVYAPGLALGGGTIDVTAASELDFVGQQTFDDATLDLGLDGSDVSVTVRNDVNSGTPPSETVTFGAGLNVVAGYGSITIDQGRHEVPDTLVNAGAITVGSTATAGDTFTIATSGYGEFDNQGTITVTNGETLDLTPQALTNTGTITADGGVLAVGTFLGGAGSINITQGGVVQLDIGSAAGATVDFQDGSGVLELGEPSQAALTIAGFNDGGVIDLTGVDPGTVTGVQLDAGDVLEIDTTGGGPILLQLSGDFTGDSFQHVADAGAGADIYVIHSPTISAPASATTGQGRATAVAGVRLSEIGSTNTETFTAVLTDTAGLLSATGTGVSGSASTSITISGTLAQVNADLASLKDSEASAGSDSITLSATDGLGNSSPSTSITVTTNGLPIFSTPASVTIGQGKATAIAGVSLSESGDTGGETFTAVLTDVSGLLTATGTGVSGSGTTSLTITGTLAEVNADLATVVDTDASPGSDTITLSATDSLGNSATAARVAVTVTGGSLPTLKAPAGKTIAAGSAIAITGVSVSEANVGGGETLTVTLTDTSGLLTATGTGVSGSDTTSLTVTGSLTQVNADLATLDLLEPAAGTDVVHVTASDSLGGVAAAKAIKVTTKDIPVITAPSSHVIGQGLTTAIKGVSVSQVDVAGGETFTVTLSDATGLLSATGPDASGSGTTTLTISGDLTEVNAELASLTILKSAAGGNTIKITATDSLGGAAAAKTIAVTANGLPVTKVPASETIGLGKTSAIAGISLSEKGTTTGETFTVVLTDTTGLLAATGSGVTGSGTTSLTISGALAQVNADLASLTDTNATAGLDKISVTTTDSLGNSGAAASIAVSVAGDPVLTAPVSKTIGEAKATAILGVTLTESGATTTETFTVTVADTSGLLTATGTVVTGSGTNSLTIHGTLAKVEAALASLKVTEAAAGSDTLSIGAVDGFGNSASAATVALTVNGLPTLAAPTTLTTDKGVATALTGVSIAETGSTTGETFTVILTDNTGLIGATGTGVTGSDSRKVTITGSLSQVNADLATLTVNKSSTGSDTITLSATDSLGEAAAGKTIAVTTIAPTGRMAHVHAFAAAMASLPNAAETADRALPSSHLAHFQPTLAANSHAAFS